MTLAELTREARRNMGLEAGDPSGMGDIYDYIDNSGNAAVAITPNGMSGGEQGWGSTGLGLTPANTQANNGGDGNAPQAGVTFNPREALQGIVSMIPNSANGEGSGGYQFRVDGSKAPQTRFGDVNITARVTDDDMGDVIDPRLVYDDPVYGRITHARNMDRRSISDMIGPLIVSGAMGGIGMLGAPSLATSLVGLGRAAGEGGDIWGRLLGMIGGQLGLPGWATSLGQLATNGLRGRDGR